MSAIDNYSRDGAICPHCGTVNSPDGDNWSLYSEETDEWNCRSCSKDFAVNVIATYAWMTERLEEDEAA